MFRQGCIRSTAIGVLAGIVVTGEIARMTPELVARPARAFLLAGLIVCAYTVAAWGIFGLIALVRWVVNRVGLSGDPLISAKVFWGGALLLCLDAIIQETARHLPAFRAWESPTRIVLFIPAFGILVWAFLRPVGSRLSTRRIEVALAVLLLPAAVVAGSYFATKPDVRLGSRGVEVFDLAPRFAPEPRDVLLTDQDMPRPRVLLIGLDGATWTRIDPGIEQGRLPNFARLVRNGVRAPLETFIPTDSPLIWTSIVTGVTPDAHGIEDFAILQLPRLGISQLRVRRAFDLAEDLLSGLGELRHVPVTSTLRRRKAIWNLTDEARLRTAIVGLWATWPPEPLENGVVVSDHASVVKRRIMIRAKTLSNTDVGPTTYPAELGSELQVLQRLPQSVTRQELGEFIEVDDALWNEFQEIDIFSRRVPLSAFRGTHLHDEFFFRAGLKLWEEIRPGFMLVYAKGVDAFSHFFWEASVPEARSLGWSAEHVARYRDVVDRSYEWIDRQLGSYIEAVDRDGNTLLIVISDHGWAKGPDGRYHHNAAPPGILLFYGAGVCRSDCPQLDEASVYDITPTILERLRLPLSEELVGRPLVEAFEAAHPTRSVARYGGPLGRAHVVASEADAQLTEQLRALGYIE